MHELNFVDHTFDLRLASEYHLSIQLGLDGFSFCILDIFRRKYIVLRHIPLIIGKSQFLPKKIEAIFDQEEMLNTSYQSVTITYSTNKATLIPKVYSGSDLFAKVASLTTDINNKEEICVNDLPGFNQQLIFCYPNELMRLLNSRFTDFTLKHKSVPLISSAVQQQKGTRKALLINFEKNHVSVIAIENMCINLYNSFYFKNEPDSLYYSLNICHNLQIDPERDEIMIGGDVADDSGYVKQLKKYVNNVQFLKPPAEFLYGDLFNKVRKHQFVSLLNTYSCV